MPAASISMRSQWFLLDYNNNNQKPLALKKVSCLLQVYACVASGCLIVIKSPGLLYNFTVNDRCHDTLFERAIIIIPYMHYTLMSVGLCLNR
jgi:hypothetical protein